MTVRRVGATTENLRKIMATTFRTANKTGFAAMSQRDLSRESGLSIGGLYGCIKTKDDLAALIADVVRYSNTAFPEWFADWSDPKKSGSDAAQPHLPGRTTSSMALLRLHGYTRTIQYSKVSRQGRRSFIPSKS